MPEAVRRQVSSILGYEVERRDFIVTNDDVKHIFDRHGDADTEIKGNNIPLEQWMFDALPDVVTSPDTIEPGKIGKGKKNAGKQSVIFTKAFPGGTVVTVQFDNKGRGTMEINTLYAKKNEDTSSKLDTAAGAAPNSTSETLEPVPSFHFTIPLGAESVNSGEGLRPGTQDGMPGATAGQAPAGPVQVGRVTTIQRPYQGKTPVQTQKSAASVTVDESSVQAAQNRIDGAQGLDGAMPGKGFKATLKDAYKAIFKPTKNVPVSGVTFEGKPYTVDINSNVPGKVISDPNLTAEKLALLDILPQVVENGEYVGSGEYVQHSSKKKAAIRYDYFETPITINGADYIAKFDVEVLPMANNYRTHQITKIDLTPDGAKHPGPAPGLSRTTSSPVEGTRPLSFDSTIPQGAEIVNSDPLLDAILGGRRVDQLKAANQQLDALAERGDVGMRRSAVTAREAAENGGVTDAQTNSAGSRSTQNAASVPGAAVNENGLTALTDQEKINLSSGKKNKIISTFSDAVAFVQNALADKSNVDRAYLGKVPDHVVRRVQADTGLDIRGFGVMMNGNDVRHIMQGHGDALVEAARGQAAVTAEDIARIPEVLSSPDKVYLSEKTDAKGRRALVFEKKIGDEYITIQGVSDGKKVLQADTLYKMKGKTRTTRDTMLDTKGAAPVINAQGEPPQSLSISQELFPATDADVGPAPTASAAETAPVEGTRPLSLDSIIAQGAESVNSDPLVKLILGGQLPEQDSDRSEGLDALPDGADDGMIGKTPEQEAEYGRTASQTDPEERDGLLRSGGQGPGADRRRAESGAEFLEREQAEGRTIRTAGRIGYGYRPVPVERQTAYAQEILRELQRLGVEAFAYEGELRANVNGYTVTDRGEAATLRDGSVGVPNRRGGELTAREIAAHEAYHSACRREVPEAMAYMDAVCAHLQVDSELAGAYIGDIVEGYFQSGYDHTRAGHRRKLMDELCAYLSGDLYEGAVDVSGMFDDYHAVKAAWERMMAGMKGSGLDAADVAERRESST